MRFDSLPSPLGSLLLGLAISLFILAGTEVLLRVLGVGNPDFRVDPFIGFTNQRPLFLQDIDDSGRVWVSTNPDKRLWFNEQKFPLVKSPTTRRAFCLGGSTTYGRPYDDKTSFCGWLRVFLNKADHGHQWEVINAGGVSYASYRVSILMDELGGYSPNLLVVYTGHNEFLEKRTYTILAELPHWLLKSFAIMSRTHLFGLMQQLMLTRTEMPQIEQGERHRKSTQGGADHTATGEVNPMLDQPDGWDEYRRDRLARPETEKHFRYNLQRMAATSKRLGVPMLWILPASNQKDMSPFKSESSLPEASTARSTFYDLMSTATSKAPLERSRSLLQRAISLDPEYAQAHFLLGRTQLLQRDHRHAARSFQQAIDEDVLPLRMTGALEKALRTMAVEEDIPLIDFSAVLERENERLLGHSILGNELFLDHVHPSIEGHRLLALEILDWMRAENLVSLSPQWNRTLVDELTSNIMDTLNVDEQAAALVKLGNVMSWARKPDAAYTLYLTAYEMTDKSSKILLPLSRAAVQLDKMSLAVEFYAEAFEKGLDSPGVEVALQEFMLENGWSRIPEKKSVFLRDLLRRAATNAMVNNLYAVDLAQKGHQSQAVGYFLRAVELAPEHMELRYNLAMSLSELGRFAEAVDHFQRFTEENPDNALAFNNLGVSLAGSGRYGSAVSAFRRALELDPSLDNARINLDRVQAKLKALRD